MRRATNGHKDALGFCLFPLGNPHVPDTCLDFQISWNTKTWTYVQVLVRRSHCCSRPSIVFVTRRKMALRYASATVGVGNSIVTHSIGLCLLLCWRQCSKIPNSVLVVIVLVVRVVFAIVMAPVDCGFGGGGNTVRCTRQYL